MKEMSSLMTIMSMKTLSSTNPIMMAISILMISIMATTMLFKATMSGWISFVTILTFSSGMMTLFMYTASLSSNEKSKNNKNPVMIMLMLAMISTAPINMKSQKESMKMFSSSLMMLIMGAILIVTMLAVSMHGHHPNQTVSTSF